jgi:hypothetical protein
LSTTGRNNTATGSGALNSNTTGSRNTAIGPSLSRNTAGNSNTAIGAFAFEANTTGSDNTGTGDSPLNNNTTGNNNIGVGFEAGYNLTTGNNNIDIGNLGVAGESSTIHIGTKGKQTRAFIAGIASSPIFGFPVVVNGNGRLGIQASSARYKRDIHDMAEASERLMKLRPVTFRYKADRSGTLQYGLVAEEVAQVYPELVTYADDGKPLSVSYHLLPAMLLNEMQKQVRESRRRDAQIEALQKQVESLRKAQIGRLTARVAVLEQRARMTPARLAAAMR